jgi:hypothetical protein
MHMAVDESRSQSCAFRIHSSGGVRRVDVFFFADSLDHSVNRYDRVGIKNGTVEISTENEAEVADYKFVGHG